MFDRIKKFTVKHGITVVTVAAVSAAALLGMLENHTIYPGASINSGKGGAIAGGSISTRGGGHLNVTEIADGFSLAITPHQYKNDSVIKLMEGKSGAEKARKFAYTDMEKNASSKGKLTQYPAIDLFDKVKSNSEKLGNLESQSDYVKNKKKNGDYYYKMNNVGLYRMTVDFTGSQVNHLSTGSLLYFPTSVVKSIKNTGYWGRLNHKGIIGKQTGMKSAKDITGNTMYDPDRKSHTLMGEIDAHTKSDTAAQETQNIKDLKDNIFSKYNQGIMTDKINNLIGKARNDKNRKGKKTHKYEYAFDGKDGKKHYIIDYPAVYGYINKNKNELYAYAVNNDRTNRAEYLFALSANIFKSGNKHFTCPETLSDYIKLATYNELKRNNSAVHNDLMKIIDKNKGARDIVHPRAKKDGKTPPPVSIKEKTVYDYLMKGDFDDVQKKINSSIPLTVKDENGKNVDVLLKPQESMAARYIASVYSKSYLDTLLCGYAIARRTSGKDNSGVVNAWKDSVGDYINNCRSEDTYHQALNYITIDSCLTISDHSYVHGVLTAAAGSWLNGAYGIKNTADLLNVDKKMNQTSISQGFIGIAGATKYDKGNKRLMYSANDYLKDKPAVRNAGGFYTRIRKASIASNGGQESHGKKIIKPNNDIDKMWYSARWCENLVSSKSVDPNSTKVYNAVYKNGITMLKSDLSTTINGAPKPYVYGTAMVAGTNVYKTDPSTVRPATLPAPKYEMRIYSQKAHDKVGQTKLYAGTQAYAKYRNNKIGTNEALWMDNDEVQDYYGTANKNHIDKPTTAATVEGESHKNGDLIADWYEQSYTKIGQSAGNNRSGSTKERLKHNKRGTYVISSTTYLSDDGKTPVARGKDKDGNNRITVPGDSTSHSAEMLNAIRDNVKLKIDLPKIDKNKSESDKMQEILKSSATNVKVDYEQAALNADADPEKTYKGITSIKDTSKNQVWKKGNDQIPLKIDGDRLKVFNTTQLKSEESYQDYSNKNGKTLQSTEEPWAGIMTKNSRYYGNVDNNHKEWSNTADYRNLIWQQNLPLSGNEGIMNEGEKLKFENSRFVDNTGKTANPDVIKPIINDDSPAARDKAYDLYNKYRDVSSVAYFQYAHPEKDDGSYIDKNDIPKSCSKDNGYVLDSSGNKIISSFSFNAKKEITYYLGLRAKVTLKIDKKKFDSALEKDGEQFKTDDNWKEKTIGKTKYYIYTTYTNPVFVAYTFSQDVTYRKKFDLPAPDYPDPKYPGHTGETNSFESTKSHAYAEFKEGSVYNETFEAMAGVPSTRTMYFASGGEEFIVNLQAIYDDYVPSPTKNSANEANRNQYRAVRKYTVHFNGVDCEYREGDTFKAIGAGEKKNETFQADSNDRRNVHNVTAEENQAEKPSGAKSSTTSTSAHGSPTKFEATWEGKIANNTPKPTESPASFDKGTAGSPCKAVGWKAGNGAQRKLVSAQTDWNVDSYNNAVKQATEWAKKMEDKGNDSDGIVWRIDDSDGLRRIYKIGKARIKVTLSDGSVNGTAVDGAGPNFGSKTSPTYRSGSASAMELKSNDKGILGSGWGYTPGQNAVATQSGCPHNCTEEWDEPPRPASGKPGEEGYTPAFPGKKHVHDHKCDFKEGRDMVPNKTGSISYTIHVEFEDGKVIADTNGDQYAANSEVTIDNNAVTGLTQIPAHAMCGSCCEHHLKDIEDVWTQKLRYDTVKFSAVKVWKLSDGYANGMSGLKTLTAGSGGGIEHEFDAQIAADKQNESSQGSQITIADPYADEKEAEKNEPEETTGDSDVPADDDTDEDDADETEDEEAPDYETGKYEDGYTAGTAAPVTGKEADYVRSKIVRCDPNIFYNIAQADTSKSGRIRYSLQTGQDDEVYYEEMGGQRSGGQTRDNLCDGQTGIGGSNRTPNLGVTPVKVNGTGHKKSFSRGCLYSNDLFSNVVDRHKNPVRATEEDREKGINTEGYESDKNYDGWELKDPSHVKHRDVNDVALKTKYTTDTADKYDMETTEWKRFDFRRNQKNTATVISDFLILQTTSGDQSIFYFEDGGEGDWHTVTAPAQENFSDDLWYSKPKMTEEAGGAPVTDNASVRRIRAYLNVLDIDSANDAWNRMWTDNSLRYDPQKESIFVGGYNGKYDKVREKYKGSGIKADGSRTVVKTAFDDDYKYFTGNSADDGGKGAKVTSGKNGSMSRTIETSAKQVSDATQCLIRANSTGTPDPTGNVCSPGSGNIFNGRSYDTDVAYGSAVAGSGSARMGQNTTSVYTAPTKESVWGRSTWRDRMPEPASARFSDNPGTGLVLLQDGIAMNPTLKNGRYTTGQSYIFYMPILSYHNPNADNTCNNSDVECFKDEEDPEKSGANEKAATYQYSEGSGASDNGASHQLVKQYDFPIKDGQNRCIGKKGITIKSRYADDTAYVKHPARYGIDEADDSDGRVLAKVNNIVIHDPVSVQNAYVIGADPKYDQRIYGSDKASAAEETAGDGQSETCPGNAADCVFRVLNCRYADQVRKAAFSIDNSLFAYDDPDDPESGGNEVIASDILSDGGNYADVSLEDTGFTVKRNDGSTPVFPDGGEDPEGSTHPARYLMGSHGASLEFNWSDLGIETTRKSEKYEVGGDFTFSGNSDEALFATNCTRVVRLSDGRIRITGPDGAEYTSSETVDNGTHTILYRFGADSVLLSDWSLDLNGKNYTIKANTGVKADGKDLTFTKTKKGANTGLYYDNMDTGFRIGNSADSDLDATYRLDNIRVDRLGGSSSHTASCFNVGSESHEKVTQNYYNGMGDRKAGDSTKIDWTGEKDDGSMTQYGVNNTHKHTEACLSKETEGLKVAIREASEGDSTSLEKMLGAKIWKELVGKHPDLDGGISGSSAAATKVKKGDILTYGYTGNVQKVTLPKGEYKLEVWGAQGHGSYGGKGGHSTGTLKLDKKTTLYIVTGGNGASNGSAYNGGGYGRDGGGGATHIATADGQLASLSGKKDSVLIVAGGGGGQGSDRGDSYGGGNGGGANQPGVTGRGGCGSPGTGGTLASGGSGGRTGCGQAGSGSFGQGGANTHIDNNGSGGAGGGYYGGGAGGHDCPRYNDYDDSGAGGGSGYARSGLTDVSGETGVRMGNGAAQITVLKASADEATILKYVDEYLTKENIGDIPDTVSTSGRTIINPIWVCEGKYDKHVCTPQCKTIANGNIDFSIECTEPHHQGKHYDVGDEMCYDACNDDKKHQQAANPATQTRKHGSGGGAGSRFILLDNYFSVHYPCAGDFYETNDHGILRCEKYKGIGYTGYASVYGDEMDCAEWTREKWICFPYSVLYYRESTGRWEEHQADEWFQVDIGYHDAAGNYHGYTDYRFYCQLVNDEMKAGHVEFFIEAINEGGPQGSPYGCEKYYGPYGRNGTADHSDASSISSLSTSNTFRGQADDLNADHSVYRYDTIDVVGRIGNLLFEDVEDLRFSNFFKKSLDNVPDLVEGTVHQVDKAVQNMYYAWHRNNGDTAEDIRGVKVSAYNEWYNTYRTEKWTDVGSDSEKSVPAPIQACRNNIAAYRNKGYHLQFGYNLLWDISTIGNYYDGNLQIEPKYYALDTKTGKVIPVDVYMAEGDQTKPVNYFGLMDEYGTDRYDTLTKDLYDYAMNLDWKHESAERNCASSDDSQLHKSTYGSPLDTTEWDHTLLARQMVAYPVTDENGTEVEDENGHPKTTPLEIPHGEYYRLGNIQFQYLGDRAKTFFGNSRVAALHSDINGGDDQELWSNYSAIGYKQDAYDPHIGNYYLKGQRWHTKLGLPSSARFTDASDVNGDGLADHISPDTLITDEKGHTIRAYEKFDFTRKDVQDRYVILETADITALGQVWNLHYDQGADNGIVEIKGKKYDLPQKKDFPTLLAVYGKSVPVPDFDYMQTH